MTPPFPYVWPQNIWNFVKSCRRRRNIVENLNNLRSHSKAVWRIIRTDFAIMQTHTVNGNFQIREWISLPDSLDEMISWTFVKRVEIPEIRPTVPNLHRRCLFLNGQSNGMAFVRLMKMRPRAHCSSFAIWIYPITHCMFNQLQLAMNLNRSESVMRPLFRIISMYNFVHAILKMMKYFEVRLCLNWNFNCSMPSFSFCVTHIKIANIEMLIH